MTKRTVPSALGTVPPGVDTMTKKQKGILFIIISAFCFSLMNMFVKLSGDLPSIQKSFFRNLVAVIVAAILLARSGSPFHWKKGNLGLLIVRASFGTLGILCNFYAISNMNLADASMLNKLSPFFVILFSYFFLKEKVAPTQTLCVIAAFLGSLFIIKPGFAFASAIPAIAGFIGGLGAGAAYTAVRGLSLRGENGPFIVFFFSAFSCLVTLPALLFDYAPMSPLQLLYLILAGVCASGGQFAITAAYANAPGKEISIYDYTIVIFAGFWSFLLWGDVPDLLSIAGYVIIFGASLFMFLYNKKQAEEPH